MKGNEINNPGKAARTHQNQTAVVTGLAP
jgi:hypothetical protein